jgi:endogenous inhibitor of DNA gyrase (YacG/DUF329 family)
MNSTTANVTCPTCKKSGDWCATAWGPFCSQRCKFIDLGEWFGGKHVISEPLPPEHLEKYSDLSAPEPGVNPAPDDNGSEYSATVPGFYR